MLNLTALKYLSINHGDQRSFFNLKSSYMYYSALSASFEYLCYGSMAIIMHLFISVSTGTVFRRQNLTSKDGPRTESVNSVYIAAPRIPNISATQEYNILLVLFSAVFHSHIGVGHQMTTMNVMLECPARL